MYNSYSAFAHSLRAKSPFPYTLLSSSSSPSDQDLLQNPYNYYHPNPYQRLPLLNGPFSKQSALLYWTPSRTFIAAAATYLATTRRSQVKLSHCTAPSSSRSCCVTVRETACCHSHCFCDHTSSSFRETRSCNKGRGQNLLEREVTQARQVWRCNEDYERACDQLELIERDVGGRDRLLQPRVSDNTRIEEHYDYWEIDNPRQRNDNSRNFNRRRRCDCEHDSADNERIRLIDQRRRRDEYDTRLSDQRRRAEYDYEDNERIRLSNQRRTDEHDDKIRHSDRRRRAEYEYYKDNETIHHSNQRTRDQHDDRIKHSDRRRRAEYDDYDEVEDVRNRDDRIRISERTKREGYDYEDIDNCRRRKVDQIKFTDPMENNVSNEKYNKMKVSDRRRRGELYEIHGEDKVRVSNQRRRDEYYDYDKEDKIRVSDQRRREDYKESDDKIRVSNRKKDNYNYVEEDDKMQRDDRIRIYDRRGRDAYYDYGNEDNINVNNRRRRDAYYDNCGEDSVRVSDRRRSDRYYDNDNEDAIRVSDRRRRNVYYDFDDEDNVRVSDRRKKEIYDERDNRLRIVDKSTRDEYYAYDEDDRIRVLDRRRRAEDYNYGEEDRIRVSDKKGKQILSKKDDKISMLDHARREEADDYEEVFTNLQQRVSATRFSDQKLERQSRFKENRDETSTSQIRQTGEKEKKYREEREHFDQKGSMDGSHIVKIISEDDYSLASRERKNAGNRFSASGTQLNLQSKTRIGTQDKRFDASTSVRNQVAVEKERNNTLSQFTASEVETDVQNRTHISTGTKQVDTSSSVLNQVQVTRVKENVVNQLAINEIELNIQNRTNVDVERKMVDTSSTVQNASQVARDKKNFLNQLTVTEVELDLQNRSQIEAERRRVDSYTSVQDVTEFANSRQNAINQLEIQEAESDIQNRNRIEAERRKMDASTSVQNVTQLVRDKNNISNQLIWSELESNVQNMSRIETERRRVGLDTSLQNATQVASERQKLVDQLAASEVELDLQNRSQTEADRIVVDTATEIHSVTQITKEKSNLVNQLMLHDNEVNVVNKADVNLTPVHVNDASILTDNLSTGTGSGTSIALTQATRSSSDRVGSSILAAGSISFRGSLESASQIEKSSSYHIGRFVDSAHQELIAGSERKGPSDSLWDQKSSASHRTLETAASGSTETENTVTRRRGQSLWAFVADIIKLGFLKGEARQLKSVRRSSSSDSKGTDDWFSGQEEMDLDMKIDEGKQDGQPLFGHVSEPGPSALLDVPEVDFSITADGTVIPTFQEKTVVEEVKGHEYTSIIGDTDKLSTSTTCIHASGVAGTTLSSSTTASGSSLEAHISRITESDKKGESKRGKLLKRTTQVPKSSFDEWEEEHSTEVETPAVTVTGVVVSGVTRVPDINTSLGNDMLILQPSEVTRNPSAGAVFTSGTSHTYVTGGAGIEAAEQFKREKQAMRIAQVQNKSSDEYNNTSMGESITATSDSTTVIAKLPESGAVEGHGSVDKGSRKHLRRLSQAPKESFDEWEEAYIREKEQRRLDEFFMREALVEAQRASDSWEVPVGAVLVRNGEVIARGCNLVEELRDSTAHAEMVCIREASNLLRSWRLSDTTLYVTLEPCAMCAGAILQARVDTVVWGAPNKLLGADGSWVRLFPGDAGTSSSLEPPVPQTGPVHPFHPKITIRRGILEDECSEIMQDFFKLRRKKKSTKPETTTNPSCLPAHPLKFFSRFGGMFCL